MKIRTPKKLDLTVVAIPFFTAAMAAEWWWQRTHPVEPGTRAGDYQLADTVASLSMGVGSLAAPYVAKKLLDFLRRKPCLATSVRYKMSLLRCGKPMLGRFPIGLSRAVPCPTSRCRVNWPRPQFSARH